MPEFTNDITVTILDENTINVDVIEQVLSITSETVGPPGGNLPGQMLLDYSIKAQIADTTGDYTANLDNGNSFQLTLTGNTDIPSIIGWPGTGEEGKATFYIEQGVGPFTLKWPAQVKWVNAAQGAVSTTPGDWDVFVLTSLDAGSTIFGFHVGRT